MHRKSTPVFLFSFFTPVYNGYARLFPVNYRGTMEESLVRKQRTKIQKTKKSPHSRSVPHVGPTFLLTLSLGSGFHSTTNAVGQDQNTFPVPSVLPQP